jgi:uncharacterized protein (TIRG00374 family)
MHLNGTTRIHISPFRMLIVLVVMAAIYYVAFRLTDLNAILTILSRSSWLWIGAAVIAMLISFLVGGVVQYLAGNFTGRLDRLCVIEFAGSFLNHFLPLSIGAIGLTSEYYRQLGRPRSQAILMATLPSIIGGTTIILIAFILAPNVIIQLTDNIETDLSAFSLLAGLTVMAVVAAILVATYKQKIIDKLTEATAGLRSIKQFRLTLLIAIVSTTQAIVSAFVLFACIHAINTDLHFMTVLVILIVAVLVSEGAPTPGGLGATEVVLIFGLTNAGLSPTQSVAVTILFRFVTFVLPIIPGGIALARIDHIMKE